MKGLDPCILQMGSRRRNPWAGDRGWLQHPWESTGCAPPCPAGWYRLWGVSGGAGGKTQQRDSPIFNSAYVSITLRVLFHVS